MTSPLPFALFRSSLPLQHWAHHSVSDCQLTGRCGSEVVAARVRQSVVTECSRNCDELPKVGLWKEISTGGMPKQQKIILWFKVTPLIETPNSWYTHFHVIDMSSNTLQLFQKSFIWIGNHWNPLEPTSMICPAFSDVAADPVWQKKMTL